MHAALIRTPCARCYPGLFFSIAATYVRRESPGDDHIPRIDSSLIYVSRKHISPSANDASIADIVAVSQARNATLDVTGALVSTDMYFAQILEGVPEAIETLMDSIHRDGRHFDVTVLRVSPITRRSFSGWSMAYSGPSNYLARHITPLLSSGAAQDEVRINRLISVMIGLNR